MKKENICENEFCEYHNSNNLRLEIAFDETNCLQHTEDPYDLEYNFGGFKVEACDALLKYRRFGW